MLKFHQETLIFWSTMLKNSDSKMFTSLQCGNDNERRGDKNCMW